MAVSYLAVGSLLPAGWDWAVQLGVVWRVWWSNSPESLSLPGLQCAFAIVFYTEDKWEGFTFGVLC